MTNNQSPSLAFAQVPVESYLFVVRMDSPDDSVVPAPAKPRTITVLGLFVAAAGLISYLATYAFTEALVKAEFLARWSPDHDPRPKRFLAGFLLLMTLFGGATASLRLLGRQKTEEDESKDDSGEAESKMEI